MTTEQQKTATVPQAGSDGPLSVLTGVAPGHSRSIDSNPPPFTVSIPQVGAYRTDNHRYYFNGEGPRPSVTTVLDVMDKPALVSWAKRTVAEIAVSHWEEVGARIQKEGSQAATDWLKGLPDYQRDTAAKLGSSVHLLADLTARSEALPAGFELSEQEMPYLEAFRSFLAYLRAIGAEIISSEKMVWSEDGYGGTYDLLVRINGELWLLDIKTSKTGPYPEWAIQLIAYGTADYIIVEDNPDPFPMPSIQRYGVLHLRPDLYTDSGWRLIEYPLVPDDRMPFLGLLEVWRWKQKKRYTKASLVTGTR